MYIPDLETRSPVTRGSWVRAIGWLAQNEAVPTGVSPHAFADRLRHLCSASFQSAEALGWPVAAGLHVCELCGAFQAGGNIGIPGPGVLFVAPEMIHHYVSAHAYRPPDEFVLAVLSCPEPGSEAYAAAVRSFRRT
jgi:hypothetical protein